MIYFPCGEPTVRPPKFDGLHIFMLGKPRFFQLTVPLNRFDIEIPDSSHIEGGLHFLPPKMTALKNFTVSELFSSKEAQVRSYATIIWTVSDPISRIMPNFNA